MKLQKNNKPIKIKDPKEFQIKLNNFIKSLAIVSFSLVVSLAAFDVVISNKLKPTDKKTTISQKYNDFDNFKKVENGVTYYKSENIQIAIDKDTFEFNEYLQNVEFDNSSDIKSYKLYEIDTEELISYYESGILYKIKGIGYNIYLIEENNFYSLKLIQEAVNFGEFKDWYTLEEIKQIESEYLKIIEKNNEYQKKLN